MKEIGGAAAIGMAMLIGSSLSAPAHAGFIVTLEQVGTDVVATGGGSIDLTALGVFGPESARSQIDSPTGFLLVGPTTQQPIIIRTGASGPTSFGFFGPIFTSSGSGDMVGIAGNGGEVLVPAGYISGNPLSDVSTWNNVILAGLANPGTYVWNWGSGATADSFTLQVGPAVAVPAPPIGQGLPVFLAVAGALFFLGPSRKA